MLPLFRILASMRGLRGTAFDLFGKTAERRMERDLIGEFEALVDEFLEDPNASKVGHHLRFFFAFQKSHFITWVNHPNQPICFFEVIPPIWANGALSSYVPNIQFKSDSNLSYPLCSAVLILKPRVGAISLISSPMNFLTIVVFPALSSPLRLLSLTELESGSPSLSL